MKLDLKGLNEEEKRLAKEAAGQVLVSGINEFLDRSESPVQGGRFKSRKKDGGVSTLFEDGDLRASITFEELESDHVEVGVFDSAPQVERLKAFNHTTGDTLPQRQFIAPPNKRFKEPIMRRVNDAIDPVRERAEARKLVERELVETILTEEDILDILGE